MEKVDFVQVQNTNDTIRVIWHFNTYKRVEKDGRVSCYIPSFDIYYSVKENDEEQIKKKGITMTTMFVDHFFKHTRNMKAFALEIHKRGFRAQNDAFAIQQFIKNHIETTKFKFSQNFDQSGYPEQFSQNGKMEVANVA